MPNFLGAIFGQRPQVPQWNDLGIADQQGKAISADTTALPGLEKLSSSVSGFNTQQLSDLMNKVLPGWSSNVAQSQKNIGSELKGEIPTDVLQAIQS